MKERTVSIKEINQRQILGLIRLNPTISRVEIIKLTNLAKVTVSTIVSDVIKIIKTGIVNEVGNCVPEVGAGRPPVKIEMNRQFCLAIGIELTRNHCIGVRTDVQQSQFIR